MFNLIFRLGMNASGFNRTLDDSKAKVSRTAKDMSGALQGSFATAIGKIGVLLGAIGATAEAKKLVEFASGFQDMSERTGVAVETLQELDYALKQTGSSAERAEKVFIKLGAARQAALANPHGKEAQQFGTFGITGAQLREMKDGGELFMRLGDAIEQTKLNANSLPVILDLIGAKNSDVLPAMAAGLRSAAMEARRMNLILSEDTIEALDDVGDKMEAMLLGLKKPMSEILLFTVKLVDAFVRGIRFLGAGAVGGFGRAQQLNPFLSKEEKKEWLDIGKNMMDDVMQEVDEFNARNDPENIAAARQAKKDRAAKKRNFDLDALIAGIDKGPAAVSRRPTPIPNDSLISVGNFLGAGPDSQAQAEMRTQTQLLKQIDQDIRKQSDMTIRFTE